jgi:hypothetical protein
METLLAALAHRERLRVVIWLIAHGPARQVEILRYLETHRHVPVNPGEVSALLKPLFAANVLRRSGARGPIEITEADELVRLLQVVASLSVTLSEAAPQSAKESSDELRRAILRELPVADAGV